MPHSPVPPPMHSAATHDPQRFVIVVFDGVSLGVMSFAFGVFDLAKYYGAVPGLDVRVVAGEPAAALTGGGLTCEVPYDLETVCTADLVIVPNWQNPEQSPPQPLLAALRTAHASGARIAGLCSGTFVLAAAGLLDHRPATTHWALAGLLARMYPAIDVRPAQLYIDGGDVLTAGGGAAGMDLGLYLLRTQFGADTASRLARYMVVPLHRSGSQAQYVQAPLPPLDEADPVGETLTWALGQLGAPGTGSPGRRYPGVLPEVRRLMYADWTCSSCTPADRASQGADLADPSLDDPQPRPARHAGLRDGLPL